MRIVEATSIENYLDRYYKKSRMTDTLLESYEEEFKRNGYVCTSHHDNVTGEFIAWPFYPYSQAAEYMHKLTWNASIKQLMREGLINLEQRGGLYRKTNIYRLLK